jgi:hypothetical protein
MESKRSRMSGRESMEEGGDLSKHIFRHRLLEFFGSRRILSKTEPEELLHEKKMPPVKLGG